MIIKNALVFTENYDFVKKDIYIDGDRISDSMQSETEIIDAEGLYAIPGLVDIHLHGCVGYDFCDGTKEAIQAIADYESSCGVTSIAPATMTLGYVELTEIFKNAASYQSDPGPGFFAQRTTGDQKLTLLIKQPAGKREM